MNSRQINSRNFSLTGLFSWLSADKTERKNQAPDLSSTFRLAMRQNAGSVCVITSSWRGKNYGFTALSVNSLCLDPPALFLAVNKKASAYQAVMSSKKFAVNILGEGQEEIARLFSDPNNRCRRFKDTQWSLSKNGSPFLEGGAAANIQCDLDRELDGYTHTILVGLVRNVIAGDTAPLVYLSGEYGRFHSHNQT